MVLGPCEAHTRCFNTFVGYFLVLEWPYQVPGGPAMALFGGFRGHESCSDPLQAYQSGRRIQEPVVGGPGGLWGTSGCVSNFLGYLLVLE